MCSVTPDRYRASLLAALVVPGMIRMMNFMRRCKKDLFTKMWKKVKMNLSRPRKKPNWSMLRNIESQNVGMTSLGANMWTSKTIFRISQSLKIGISMQLALANAK